MRGAPLLLFFGSFAACSGAPPAREAVPTPRALASASSSAASVVGAPSPPGPPVLVVRTARFSEPGYFRPRFGASLSPDGSLVALWGPELKLVATADGSVRAQYGGCVAGAAFAPDGRSLVLLGCAEEPAKSDVVGDATKSVYRWDLPTDSVRDLGSGPYETVELTTDGTRIIAIGSHDARVLSASDGTVVHAFKIDESGSYSGGERRGAGVLRRLVEESPLRG